jgi:hypothetical protein
MTDRRRLKPQKKRRGKEVVPVEKKGRRKSLCITVSKKYTTVLLMLEVLFEPILHCVNVNVATLRDSQHIAAIS